MVEDTSDTGELANNPAAPRAAGFSCYSFSRCAGKSGRREMPLRPGSASWHHHIARSASGSRVRPGRHRGPGCAACGRPRCRRRRAPSTRTRLAVIRSSTR